MLAKGTVLATPFEEYIVKEQIGQGGNGTVFLVVSSDGESFAIKIINKNANRKTNIKRFKNEINFCQKKDNHKNIIKVIDYGVYKNGELDCLFYVMPYYDSTLRKEIKKGIDSSKALSVLFQLLDGLKFAHEKGIWHRDMKPENILYDTKNQIVIIADFGIAHFCEDDIITAVETQKGERLANYMYAAPEQRTKGINIDGRTDIFALGLILNEMFTNTVIGGSKYKTITDCCEEYGFLDKVVEELISQNPMNRLYPAEKVIIEISALIKLESDKKELKRMIENKIRESTDEDPLYTPPRITNTEYKDNRLVFYLDKETNALWNDILTSGEYDHHSIGRYKPQYITTAIDSEKNCCVLIFEFLEDDVNIIDHIVRNLNAWLITASGIYTNKERQRREHLMREEIEKRNNEIKTKKNDMRIKEKLKTLTY